MRTINKLLLVLLVGSVIYLGIEFKMSANLAKEVGNENKILISQLAEADEHAAALEKEMEALKLELSVVQPSLDEIRNTYHVEDLTVEQLSKAIEISKTTELDLEGSFALVKYSDTYGVDYALVLSIIEIESNFDRYLVGTSNDRGYMQIIPNTEKFLVEAYGKELGIEYNPERIFEPDYNLALGIAYIHQLADIHGNDLNKILTEYNRGPYGLAQYYQKYKTYETQYSKSVLSKKPKYIALSNQ